MPGELDNIRNELKITITPSRLKEISIALIDHFKRKEIHALERYAARAELETKGLNASRLFAQLMQRYHPDKFAHIMRDIDALYEERKIRELLALKAVYVFKDAPMTKPVPEIFEEEEEYQFTQDDFGFAEEAADDGDEYGNIREDDDPSEIRVFDVEYNFTEAANRHFYGNLDEALTVSDLRSLDRELDLSGYGIASLMGVEHCINLLSLNLSGNAIHSITPLHGLERLESLFLSENEIERITALSEMAMLRELDLSFNRIEDITPLRGLAHLEYVNLVGNPIKTKEIVNELLSRGVMVIV